MDKKILRLSFIFSLFLLFSCKDFIGNPHKVSLPPRLSKVEANDLTVEPPNWWVGLSFDTVEIMMHGKGLAGFACTMQSYKGVELLKIDSVENTNYRFAQLVISPEARPGRLGFYFTKKDSTKTVEFPLFRRDKRPKASGVSPKDAIYLLYPDRFANGDTTNDSLPYLVEQTNRANPEGRHGGDLKGVLNHLDYIKDLGCTAIWLNPELENNQTTTSYHGYAITNLYKIDPRLGSNLDYRFLSDSAHRMGLKIIRDIVPNHVGDQHKWLNDLPEKNWFNQWDSFQRTSFRSTSLLDPHAAASDFKQFNAGWFDQRMPDLNQKNPRVAKYLIQQAIWWIEYAGIDAFRVDTYAYSDPNFTAAFCTAIHKTYPNFSIFGEIWENSVLAQARFAKNKMDSTSSNLGKLDGVIDFRLCFALHEALLKEPTWEQGVVALYETLAQDFIYENAAQNVIMLDNHDMSRFYSVVDKDFEKWKSGMALLLTLRGIPQLYYGTELLFEGEKSAGDPALRPDFSGGWASDSLSKFEAKNRTKTEQAAFAFLQKLLNYRKSKSALQTGDLVQFVPENGLYAYCRQDTQSTFFVVFNAKHKEKTIDINKFQEIIKGYNTAKNILNEEIISITDSISIAPYSTLIFELKK